MRFLAQIFRKYDRILPALAAAILLLVASCTQHTSHFTEQEHNDADSVVAGKSVEQLDSLQKQYAKDGNRLGSIVALREKGKALRNASHFNEALTAHIEGLNEAKEIGDTLEWIKALNNVGTDYRRMSVLDVAQEYHINAWVLSKEFSDTSTVARKNRVVSLNGLGNIYMSVGNYERADSALRMALAGETELGSLVGMAINYANLGSILEYKNLNDSAWVYYRKSMALNQEAGNQLGIALCHNYFGKLHEKAREYDKATVEYETAARLMQESKDQWHAVTTIISLAGIHLNLGNYDKVEQYLAEARTMAEGIESQESLAEIYNLYYTLYKHQGKSREALEAFEKSTQLRNASLNMEKVNRIQNTTINIERNMQKNEISKVNATLSEERSMRKTIFLVGGTILLLLTAIIAMMAYTIRVRKRSHDQLTRLTALRENFFTNVTHEFRTPLTVVLGLSRDLQRTATGDVADKACVIERQGNGLLQLINQLLDIAKVKSAVGNPEWRNGNISAYITMITESYQDYAHTRDIKLEFMAKGDIVMDYVPDYMRKVLNNLISNALKFTPQHGKVQVAVWPEGDTLRIDVSDTGKGIEKESLPHIFEPFYQADTSNKVFGTGVGLALVRQIVDLLKGEITVNSTVGRGTIFHIALPIHNNYTQQPYNEPLTQEGAILPDEVPQDNQDNASNDDSACRVLVIEDNRDIAAYIGTQLDNRYAVYYAHDGKAGVKRAIELVPDLIITDLMMPEMDGLEVCRSIRGNEIVNHIPIIVVTAKCTEEERIRGIEAGADAYLPKPFNSEELQMWVGKLLENRRMLSAKYKGAEAVAKPDSETETPEATAQTQHDKEMCEADTRFVNKVTDMIYKHMDKREEINVTILASDVCMSNSQLYRKLVAITGSTPTAFVQQVRIAKAKSIMDKSNEIPLADIADQCGFDLYPNFVRSFKNVCGITPSEYRKSRQR